MALISALIYNFLVAAKKECYVLTSDMKVYIPVENRWFYPDISIICDEPEFHLDNKSLITNPQLIVEVLSDSTEKWRKI